MRISGGVSRGKSILFPGKSKARPTSDRIKESLFDILSTVEGKTFLDAFAGSGSVGLEALSRGATGVIFIERDAVLADYILRNLKRCGFTERYEILEMELRKAVPLLLKRKARFDFLFADPPYEAGLVGEILGCLGDGKLFSEDGILIIQHSRREEPVWEQAVRLILCDQRRYGDTLLSFLVCREGIKNI